MPRVRYVYQENGGLSAARNTGIRHAAGLYLTYLDSDDLFLPKKLELLVGALESQPEPGLVAGQAVLIDENSQPMGEVFETALPDDPTQLLLGNPLHVGSVLLRREWQDRVGFFDESLRSYEDWEHVAAFSQSRLPDGLGAAAGIALSLPSGPNDPQRGSNDHGHLCCIRQDLQ